MELDGYAGGEDAFTPEEEAAFAEMASGGGNAVIDDGSGAAPDLSGDGECGESGAGASDQEADAATKAAEDAAKAEAEKEGQARDEKGKFVPHGALHEERERRKAVEATNAQMRDALVAMNERMKIFAEATGATRKEAGPVKEEVPDPEKDIFGYVKHLEGKLSALSDTLKQTSEQTAAERERGTVLSGYGADVNRFKAETPAFDQAYAYLMQNRMEELTELGFSPAEAKASIEADEMALVKAALAARQSPAARVFKMATLRGFKAAAAEPSAEEKAAAHAAETAKATKEATDRLDMQTRGAAASKSLSSAGGAAATEMTVAALVAMSDSEFAAYEAKHPRAVARLMGAGES